MRTKKEYFFCSERILAHVSETHEIDECISAIDWMDNFSLTTEAGTFAHQSAYNKALEKQFLSRGWDSQPLLCKDPKLIGDFMKNDVFVEVQFGNSSTLYRDYYKFHYGLMHGLLSLAVLVVPVDPRRFFPTRPESVSNMAVFDLAYKCYKLLPIPVPILLVGLIPE